MLMLEDVRRAPGSPKDESRVGDRQCGGSNYDHGAFQHHECNLIVGEGALEAALEFGHAETGSNVDGDERDAKS